MLSIQGRSTQSFPSFEIKHESGYDIYSSTAEVDSLPYFPREVMGGFLVGLVGGKPEFGNLALHVRTGCTHDAEMVAYVFRYKVEQSRAELGDLEASRERLQKVAHELLDRGYRRVSVHYAIYDLWGERVLMAAE